MADKSQVSRRKELQNIIITLINNFLKNIIVLPLQCGHME